MALITGGAGGLGSSTAKLFCQRGAKILIADIQDDHGHLICEELGHANASFIHCNVTSEMDVQNAVYKAVVKHGKLDIMVNNAGIMGSKKTDILDNDQAEFEHVHQVNVTGTFLCIKHAARVMKANRGGSIINMASVCSLGQFGIRVNCVSPYAVPTPMSRKLHNLKDDDPLDVYSNLKGVALMPEDVAQSVLYLASDESKYVSGHNLIVDGGFTIVNTALTMFG